MQTLQLLNTTEAASRLRVHPTTVQRWARSGALPPAVQVPGYRGALLFAPEVVEALVQERAS